MDEIVGYIHSILFKNDESFYQVARVILENEDKPIVITGYFQSLTKNQLYRFKGLYTDHPRFGIQFQVESYEEIVPTDEEAIVRFLSSPLFKGVGPLMAKRIYDALGEQAIEKIQLDYEVLANIPGMKKELMESIHHTLNEHSETQSVIQFFMGYGIGLKDTAKIIAVYKKDAVKVIQDNPYQLIDTIEGIGFNKVDALAQSMGFDCLNIDRLKAALYYGIKNLCMQTGDTYCLESALFDYLKKVVKLDALDLKEAYLQLIEEHRFILEEQRLYYDVLYHAENYVAQRIQSYLHQDSVLLDESLIEQEISRFEAAESIQYDEYQKQAIKQFILKPISILTGGPGTGKTTVVKAIVHLYQLLFPEQKMAIVAPTGRAAKRLNELTGVQAFTIHSLLRWDMHTNRFDMNESNPLEYDVIIIDEFSMVDIQLFSHLLKASYFVNKILMIGDEKQLPSVAPGNVLNDLIDSKQVPTIVLNKIFRQMEHSGIISLAHAIRNDVKDIELDHLEDVIFKEYSAAQSYAWLTKYLHRVVEKGYHQDDIQILAPMYSGAMGIDRINQIAQAIFNPKAEEKRELIIGRRVFREGDKILQLKNRPDDMVFNGDIGTLVDIGFKMEESDRKNTLYVDFDGLIVSYKPNDYITITHAYCMSVHKAQGNEFKQVVMPILPEHSRMLTKKLVYTGLTRAKELLIMLGSKTLFNQAILDDNDDRRQTTLLMRLTSKN